MTRRSKSSPSSDLLPLFEFSNIVNASIDVHFILGTVLLTVMGKMLVGRGMVLLRRDGDVFEVVAAKGLGRAMEGTVTEISQPSAAMKGLKRVKKTSARYQFFSALGLRLVVPIVVHSNVVGLLALGDKLSSKAYSESDRKLIQSLVNLSGSAVEKGIMLERLRVANRSLDTRYQELNTLFELSKEFNLVLDDEKVIRLLTFSLLGQVGVNQYGVCLERNGTMEFVASKIERSSDLEQAVQVLAGLRGAFLTTELLTTDGFRTAAEQLEKAKVHAVIPMQVQNQTKGVILLGEKLRGGIYGKGDLEFLYSLGNLAIISIENARLFKETLEKQRMQEELKIAREIQQGLLPARLPKLDDFDLAAVNISSKEVGGDYYDVLQLSEGRIVLAVGDVSGKGTGAALLMANVQAALRAFAPLEYTLPEATARINDLTCENTGGDKFITLFWGTLDTKSKTLRYVNAGHNQPFLVRSDKSVERLEEGGIILGMMKTTRPYREGSVTLAPGDTLFLFTDGVSEAMNGQGEDFTEERLEDVVRQLSGSPAGEIIRGVQQEVDRYVGGTPQSDDMTMMVLRVT